MAVFRTCGTGNLGGGLGAGQIDRIMNLLGGQLNHYNSYSTAQIVTDDLYLRYFRLNFTQ